jgi:hypothetical protein
MILSPVSVVFLHQRQGPLSQFLDSNYIFISSVGYVIATALQTNNVSNVWVKDLELEACCDHAFPAEGAEAVSRDLPSCPEAVEVLKML